MPTKVELRVGNSTKNSHLVSMVLASDLPQGQPYTVGRPINEAPPVTASDVVTDMLTAWNGVCSVDGYVLLAAKSYIYDLANADNPLSISEETPGSPATSTAPGFSGLSDQSINIISYIPATGRISRLQFPFASSLYTDFGDRVDFTTVPSGNLVLVQQFILNYRGVARLARTATQATNYTWEAVGPMGLRASHGRITR